MRRTLTSEHENLLRYHSSDRTHLSLKPKPKFGKSAAVTSKFVETGAALSPNVLCKIKFLVTRFCLNDLQPVMKGANEEAHWPRSFLQHSRYQSNFLSLETIIPSGRLRCYQYSWRDGTLLPSEGVLPCCCEC